MLVESSELANDMTEMRYYETGKRKAVLTPKESEFLRTGRINRNRPNWDEFERRTLSYEEVAQRTGRYLTFVGEKTHERINSFHKSIRFRKAIFHRTLKGTPHLGYCHVTLSKSSFAEHKDVPWAFYIANFFADIAPEELAFEKINMRASRMYFAIALEKAEDGKKLAINRKIRGDGLLFRTEDPKVAMKNVLMLGAKHDTLRRIIRAL